MGFCSVKINFSVNPHFLLIKPQKVVGKNVKFDKKSWEKVYSIIFFQILGFSKVINFQLDVETMFVMAKK
jgi:hypothetical protein